MAQRHLVLVILVALNDSRASFFLLFSDSVRVELVETILSSSDEQEDSLAKHAEGATQNRK